MKEQLKVEIDKTLEHIRVLKNVIKDKSRSFPEDTRILWEHSNDKLSKINDKLKEALNKIDGKSDETLLQAHLAAMEAHCTWERTRNAFESFAHKTARQTRTEIDHTSLQAHLAKMEVEDFMETRGKTIVRNFETSRDKVEKATVDAVKELKEYFGKIDKDSFKVD